jgi:hypothetical protein
MYDLHRLGWRSFQQLCLTITREVFGQTVGLFSIPTMAEATGLSLERGIPWGGEALEGRFVSTPPCPSPDLAFCGDPSEWFAGAS